MSSSPSSSLSTPGNTSGDASGSTSPDRTPSDELPSDISSETVRFEGQALAEVLGIRPQTLSGAVRQGHRAAEYDVMDWAVWHPRASQVIGYDVPGAFAQALLPPEVRAAYRAAHRAARRAPGAPPQVTLGLLHEAAPISTSGDASTSDVSTADASTSEEAKDPSSQAPELEEIQALMDMASRHGQAPEGSVPTGPTAASPTAEAYPTAEALLEASAQLLQAALRAAIQQGYPPKRIVQLIRERLQNAHQLHQRHEQHEQEPTLQEPALQEPASHGPGAQKSRAQESRAQHPASPGSLARHASSSRPPALRELLSGEFILGQWFPGTGPVSEWRMINWVFGGRNEDRAGTASAEAAPARTSAPGRAEPAPREGFSSTPPSSRDPSSGSASSAARLAVYPQDLPPGLGR